MTKKVPAATTGKQIVPTCRAKFVDFEGKSQTPAATFENTCIAVQHLDLQFSLDVFRDRRYVGGMALTTDTTGQITDDAIAMVRRMIRQKFGFNPGKDQTWDAVNLLCRTNAFHPVRDYLESLQKWDGVKRIDRFFTDYMGAPDTDFICGVSRIVLLASVRRIYQPGCKFDYMTVLESPEGYNKSTAIAKLYGPEFFSDQSFLGIDDKVLQETVRGRWALEAADLSGMRKGDVDKIKAQLTRVEDRTRPAYGRAVIDAPRSCIFFGTTNETQYLRSQTGNRRFFPVPVGRIDVAAIERDRDQIWAEAIVEEQFADSIMLPQSLWEAAGAEQDARTLTDPWVENLQHFDVEKAEHRKDYEITAHGEERVASKWLISEVLELKAATVSAETGKRLGIAMRKLGWQGPKGLQICGRFVKGYCRRVTEPWG